MKRNSNKYIFLLLLIIALSIIVGCSSSKPLIRSANGTIFKDWTEPHKIDCDVKKKYKKIKVDITIKSTSNAIKFEIRNEKDEIVWDGKIESGKNFSDIKTFDAKDGTWNAYIYSDNAEGSFDIKWSKES